MKAFRQNPGDLIHNDRTALRLRKPQHGDASEATSGGSPIEFRAYFDTTTYKTMIDQINEEIKEKMREFMDRALEQARDTTAADLKTTDRAFKSAMKPHKKAAGDLYETIANSLDYEETLPSSAGYFNNQFAGFLAGSRADGTFASELTGVMGSRMGPEDRNLIELTEDGWAEYDINKEKIGAYYAGIKRNPAKRMRGG
jgi:hypothetical protein